MIFILYVFLWLLKSKTKILSKWQTAQLSWSLLSQCQVYIRQSNVSITITLTIRLGKGVNVTLTVLWHILVQCILWSHYEICKRVIIMLYGIEKSMHIFHSVECNNYFNFFSRQCTTSPVVMPPGFYCCKRGCSAVYWDYLLLLSRKAGLWCLQKQSTIAWGGCKGSWS